ncbi:uncharacterized protein HMPREF1120_05909 [Exophiala dermatitidis NIH/UT8656]|uniref:Uncharacterized protein n=1 Tax=Exophiala dermatitidis (strain ATCC 34100 / CBS 525.76 / NIH/UT8656) TaxID=858893 RepID=H6C2B5_EXODN|nr:uncharacterized protein HMPREF1120_05909 [Exophiala dermatitidis NIH/UT8656]EHY57887.1 hypothetical protein HMPREF1120_05909 [Exophiala dermatitidis NIH/UT8656]
MISRFCCIRVSGCGCLASHARQLVDRRNNILGRVMVSAALAGAFSLRNSKGGRPHCAGEILSLSKQQSQVVGQWYIVEAQTWRGRKKWETRLVGGNRKAYFAS